MGSIFANISMYVASFSWVYTVEVELFYCNSLYLHQYIYLFLFLWLKKSSEIYKKEDMY